MRKLKKQFGLKLLLSHKISLIRLNIPFDKNDFFHNRTLKLFIYKKNSIKMELENWIIPITQSFDYTSTTYGVCNK